MFVVVIPRLPGSICMAPAFVFLHGRQPEFDLPIFRIRKAGLGHVTIDAIHAFAEFLHEFLFG
jgi:hypothetical protein